MTQPRWSAEQRLLWRQARHQVLLHMTATPYSPFDAEHNVVGDDRPRDFKRYWDNLTDTERAFEILQNTEAAVFIQYWNKIQAGIPKPHIAP
jgi:hypothetical protein